MKTIPLPCGKQVLVDDEDYDRLSQYPWWSSGKGYARRTERNAAGRTTFYMHRELMQCPARLQVDHVNGDGLDNRKENLRVCTRSQNGGHILAASRALSGFRGVWWKKDKRRWQAEIMVNRQRVYLGRFGTSEEAAKAYDAAAIRLRGPFATLNFTVEIA